MAYVNLATAEKLFASRYGSVTSVRVAPRTGGALGQTIEQLEIIAPQASRSAIGGAGVPADSRPPDDRQPGRNRLRRPLPRLQFLSDRRGARPCRLALPSITRSPGQRSRAIDRDRIPGADRSLPSPLGRSGAGRRGSRRSAWHWGWLTTDFLLQVLVDLWPDKELANVLRPHVDPMSFALGFALTVFMALGGVVAKHSRPDQDRAARALRGESEPPTAFTASGSRFGRLDRSDLRTVGDCARHRGPVCLEPRLSGHELLWRRRASAHGRPRTRLDLDEARSTWHRRWARRRRSRDSGRGTRPAIPCAVS